MIRLVLTWTLALLHHVLPLSTERMATAIAAASDSADDAAVLTVIGLYENTLDPRRGVPWGACARLCASHCGECHGASLENTARWSLHVIKRGRRLCSWAPSAEREACAMHFYHSGSVSGWRADHFAQHEARMVARLIAAESLRVRREPLQ